MIKSFAALIAAPLLIAGTAFAADPQPAAPTPGAEAGQPTSDRTPQKETKTPLEQTTQDNGKTSDRTPGNKDQPATVTK